jgi:uncharacterized lipoprotein
MQRSPTLTTLVLAAGMLAACGDNVRTEETARDRPVTTQNAADAVAADVSEDVREATAGARRQIREGAAEAGQELEQLGDTAQSQTPPADPDTPVNSPAN